ncbi:MAG: Rieske (2Fe-2S) protein [Verrucomicrobiales bacterium]
MNHIEIGTLAQVQKQGSLKFAFKEEGIPREGFVAWFEGALVAYENRCRHIPVSLDYGDAKFFNPDGTYFQCQTHGAIYKPDTGECVRGPCVGARLRKLPVFEENGRIFLIAPDSI